MDLLKYKKTRFKKPTIGGYSYGNEDMYEN